MEDMMVIGGVLENPQLNIGQGRTLPYLVFMGWVATGRTKVAGFLVLLARN